MEVHEKDTEGAAISEEEIIVDVTPVTTPMDAPDVATDSDETAQTHSITFKDLKLKPELIKAVEDLGYEHPTEVQCKYIPHIIRGEDVLCEAPSSSGKSVAMVLATLQNFTPQDGKITMLILCHSHGGALHIAEDYERLSHYMFKSPIKLAVFSDVIDVDIEILQNDLPHIIVGTFGKVRQLLLQEKILNVNDVKVIGVRDCGFMIQAPGFIKDLLRIIQKTACEKQVLLFSTPMNETDRILCRQVLNTQQKGGMDVYKRDTEGTAISKEEIIVDVTTPMDTPDEVPIATDSDATAQTHSTTFKDLKLKPELVKAVEDLGYEHPTEVQCKYIPHIIRGEDVLCEAPSGSGKSVAMVLATLQNFTPQDGKITMFILCNTRRSAEGIAADYQRFSRYMFTSPIKVAIFRGGTSAGTDRLILKDDHPHIVVGTLGRVRCLIAQSNILNVNDVKVFGVHACGHLLQHPDSRKDFQMIFQKFPREKQVLLCSTPMHETVRLLCRQFLIKSQEAPELCKKVDEMAKEVPKPTSKKEKRKKAQEKLLHDKMIRMQDEELRLERKKRKANKEQKHMDEDMTSRYSPKNDAMEVNENDTEGTAISEVETIPEDTTIATGSDVTAPTPRITFKDLKLKPELIRAFKDKGFKHPTEVQCQLIPPIINGEDVLCDTPSGYDKRLGIALATLQNFTPEDGKITMVTLCKTRASAISIGGDYQRLSRYLFRTPIKVAFFRGGTKLEEDRMILENDVPHIVVATSGRSQYLLQEKALNLNDVEVFSVHECDNMLKCTDLRKSCQMVFQKLPHQTQVLFISPPMHENAKLLCRQFLNSRQKHGMEVYKKDTEGAAISEEEVIVDVTSPMDTPDEVTIATDSDATAQSHSTTFKDLKLKPELVKAVEDLGYERPTEVQCSFIPHIINGEDVLCEAPSGTGKSTAMVLATLQNFAPIDGKMTMIILCSTRDSACRIAEYYHRVSTYMITSPIKVAVFYGGGSNVNSDRRTLQDDYPHIAVGTLGRITLLVQEKILKLNDVRVIGAFNCGHILGESSRKQFQLIFQKLPREKQVLLLSTPMNERVKPLYRQFFRSQEQTYINCIAPGYPSQQTGIVYANHYYINLREYEKEEQHLDNMHFLNTKRVLIYAKECWKCKAVALTCNPPALYISQSMSGTDRRTTYNKITDSDTGILVACMNIEKKWGSSDVTFDVVINYDLPSQRMLLNMISKAGKKADQNSMTVTFVLDDELKQFKAMQECLGITITELDRGTDWSTMCRNTEASL